MTTERPETYTDGLGEFVRASRVYCGVSQRTFADKIGIKEKSLSDIEIGRRPAPRGFLDSVDRVVDQFDDDVSAATQQAEQMLMDLTEKIVSFDVSGEAVDEWGRAVIGRAAVESGLIMPVLTNEHTAGVTL